MKPVYLLAIILFFLIIACERNDDPVIPSRDPYLVVGDTNNCLFRIYNPEINFNSESDSFDIDFDLRNDLEFRVNDVFIDDCEEFLNNCPPDVICDCWPTIYTDYIVNLSFDMQIAINNDSTNYNFIEGDTISNLCIWSDQTKFPIIRRTPYDVNRTGSYNLILGLRKINNHDTLYCWIKLRIENPGIYILGSSIQK